MKGCPTARSQPTVNPCLHLHISGKCLQADPYQRPQYPELKFAVELPTSAAVTLELLLQAQRVPVLRSWHKTTEWLASKRRGSMERSHHKSTCNSVLRPQFSAVEVMTRCCVQTWPTRAGRPEPVRRVATSSRLRAPTQYENQPSQMTNQRCVCSLSFGAHTSTFKEKLKESETRLTHWASINPILVYNLSISGYFWR